MSPALETGGRSCRVFSLVMCSSRGRINSTRRSLASTMFSRDAPAPVSVGGGPEDGENFSGRPTSLMR